MQRLNLALFPHKGIRNMFSQFIVLTGNLDYTNKQKVSDFYDFGKFFFEFLAIHSDDENSVMLSDLEKKSPGASKHDMDEHEEIEKEQTKLEKSMDSIYEKSKKDEDVSEDIRAFYLNLSKFQSMYFLHMLGEETVTVRQLWDNFTDEELIDMRTRIIAKMKKDVFVKWSGFLFPSLNPSERKMLFNGFKANAPADFFSQVSAVVEKNLSPAEFNALVS